MHHNYGLWNSQLDLDYLMKARKLEIQNKISFSLTLLAHTKLTSLQPSIIWLIHECQTCGTTGTSN